MKSTWDHGKGVSSGKLDGSAELSASSPLEQWHSAASQQRVRAGPPTHCHNEVPTHRHNELLEEKPRSVLPEATAMLDEVLHQVLALDVLHHDT